MKEKERITTKRERERSLGECMVQKGHNIETSMFLEGFLRFLKKKKRRKKELT